MSYGTVDRTSPLQTSKDFTYPHLRLIYMPYQTISNTSAFYQHLTSYPSIMPIGISSSIWYTLLITAVQPSSHLQLSYRYLSDVYPELNSYLTLSRLSTERLNIIQTVSSTGSVYYLSATYQGYVTLILGYISSSNLACSLDSNTVGLSST